jgi:hypothetical protein
MALNQEKVLTLYQGCLTAGYHPRCFRHAILAIIQKPNKTDWTRPRSYRPIALLSVLGKGLERLVVYLRGAEIAFYTVYTMRPLAIFRVSYAYV